MTFENGPEGSFITIQLHIEKHWIDILVEKGYLAWPSRADPLAISKAIKKYINDLPMKS